MAMVHGDTVATGNTSLYAATHSPAQQLVALYGIPKGRIHTFTSYKKLKEDLQRCDDAFSSGTGKQYLALVVAACCSVTFINATPRTLRGYHVQAPAWAATPRMEMVKASDLHNSEREANCNPPRDGGQVLSEVLLSLCLPESHGG